MKKKNTIIPTVKVEDKDGKLMIMEPDKFQALVLSSMPAFLQKIESKEDMANAMMETGQEMLLAVEDVLVRYFKFTEEDLKKLHRHLYPILRGVKEFESHGLSIMTPHSMGVVGDKVEDVGIGGLLAEIADIRNQKGRMNRAGVEYPTMIGATPFIKQIKGNGN